MSAPAIQRIVLTGGPCAGKSTALDRVTNWLRRGGVRVFRVPEAATLLLSGGIHVAGATPERVRAFQRGILRTQLAMEESFLGFAREHPGEPSVLLCDRGALDSAAYLAPPTWAEVLAETGLTEPVLLGRYDAVVHLMTAALGAEGHYGTATNAVRFETAEEARGVDERLRLAWGGHARLRVIDNSTGFEAKMSRVLAEVAEVVGIAAAASQP